MPVEIHLRPYQDNLVARGLAFPGWARHDADAARHVIASLPLPYSHASSIYPARLLQRLLDEWYIWHRGDMLEPTRGAVRQCYDAWQAGHKRVLLAAVTGDGKTEIAVKIAYDCARRGWRCVFVCDQQNLVTQSAGRFAKYGLRVGVIWAEARKYGLTIDPTAPIQVASLQTLQASERQAAKTGTTPFWHAWRGAPRTLWILDEAHDQTAWSPTFGRPLLNTPGQSLYLLLTGSPFRLSPQEGMGDIADWLAWTRCYRDAVRISVPEVVAAYRAHGHMIESIGSILPVRYIGARATAAMMDTTGIDRGADGDYSTQQLTRMGVDPALLSAQCREWSSYGFKRTLAFCCTIKHAQACAAHWISQSIPSGIVTGEETTTGIQHGDTLEILPRKDVCARLASGQLRIIFSIGAMIKGVDIAEIDSGLCLRPTDAEELSALFVQMVGRIRRPCPWLGLLSVTWLDMTDNALKFARNLETMDAFELVKGRGKEVKRGKKKPSGKQCPKCMSVVDPSEAICPYCQYVLIQPEPPLARVELKTYDIDITGKGKSAGRSEEDKDRDGLRFRIRDCYKKDYAPGAAYHRHTGKVERQPKDAWALHAIYPNPTPANTEEYMHFLKRKALERDAKKRKIQPDAEFVRHWFRLEFGQVPILHPDFFTDAYPGAQNNSPV